VKLRRPHSRYFFERSRLAVSRRLWAAHTESRRCKQNNSKVQSPESKVQSRNPPRCDRSKNAAGCRAGPETIRGIAFVETQFETDAVLANSNRSGAVSPQTNCGDALATVGVPHLPRQDFVIHPARAENVFATATVLRAVRRAAVVRIGESRNFPVVRTYQPGQPSLARESRGKASVSCGSISAARSARRGSASKFAGA